MSSGTIMHSAGAPNSIRTQPAEQIGIMEAHDLPEVLTLYRRLWLQEKACSMPALEAYFSRLFFHHPWPDSSIRSLVCRDGEGHVIGCLGIMPRRMVLGGQAVRVAVSHNFMVDPRRRASMAAVELMKAFFAGPQDLSLAEGNAMSRKLWEGLGGTTALLHNLRWVRPLRPAGFLLHSMTAQGLPTWLRTVGEPFCAVADAVVHRTGWGPFSYSPGLGRSEELQDETFVELGNRWAESRWVWPHYDLSSFTWLIDMLRRKRGLGTLRKMLVRGPQDQILGSYLYFAKPQGTSEVLHVLAKPSSIGPVLDHLFHDAWTQGSYGISGQLEPRWMSELTLRQCVFLHSGSWMLIHSQRPGIVEAIHQGKAFLSRLDGEWWIGLHQGTL